MYGVVCGFCMMNRRHLEPNFQLLKPHVLHDVWRIMMTKLAYDTPTVSQACSFIKPHKFRPVHHIRPHFHQFYIMAANTVANIAQNLMGEAPVQAFNEDKQNTFSSEMLACCWEGKENLQMKMVPIPDITDYEDVLIRVTGSTGML